MTNQAELMTGKEQPNDFALRVATIAIAFSWLLSAIPVPILAVPVVLFSVVLPLLFPALVPMLLVTSFLFYSTMNVPAELLYLLRLYWIVIGLFYMMVVRRATVPATIWMLYFGVAALIGMGVVSGIIQVGGFSILSRSPLLEGLLALLWVSSCLLGYFWIRMQDGTFTPLQLNVVLTCWVISVWYGIAQMLFGLSELTVPSDLIDGIVGFQQYEEIGRRPFSFPTSNGICVISLMVLPILYGKKQAGRFWRISILLTAVAVGILTLTRSYLLLLTVFYLGSSYSYRRGAGSSILIACVSIAILITVVSVIELDSLMSIFRIADGAVDNTRVQIWSYVIQNFSMSDWFFGFGFGSDSWANFFWGLNSSKKILSPHSATLEIIGQFGLLGLGFYVTIIATITYSFYRLRTTIVGPGAAIAAGLIVLREQVSASYIFSPSFLSGIFWIVFGVMIAQLACERARVASVTAATRGLPAGDRAVSA